MPRPRHLQCATTTPIYKPPPPKPAPPPTCREAASTQLQRAARYATLQDSAAELDAESATWHLLWHLHGVASRDWPGGRGGNFVEGAGLAKTRRQAVADLLFQDEALNRYAARACVW